MPAAAVLILMTAVTLASGGDGFPAPPAARELPPAPVTAPLKDHFPPRTVCPNWQSSSGDVPESGGPRLRSAAWYVVDEENGRILTAHDAETPVPIASITKLAAALVYADCQVPDDKVISIDEEAREFLQITRSRLRVGSRFRAGDLIDSALVSSDNRAMVSLARATGLSMDEFVRRMNAKGSELGLDGFEFHDPTGLDPRNRASARSAARLLAAAAAHPKIGPILGLPEYSLLHVDRGRQIHAHNSNALMRNQRWEVLASKTGYTLAAGSCLVMRTRLADGRLVTVALLGAEGVGSRYGDAARLRSWLEGPIAGRPSVLASHRLSPHRRHARG